MRGRCVRAMRHSVCAVRVSVAAVLARSQWDSAKRALQPRIADSIRLTLTGRGKINVAAANGAYRRARIVRNVLPLTLRTEALCGCAAATASSLPRCSRVHRCSNAAFARLMSTVVAPPRLHCSCAATEPLGCAAANVGSKLTSAAALFALCVSSPIAIASLCVCSPLPCLSLSLSLSLSVAL